MIFYYFVVHKKVKIQSHVLISLHHILSSKKQHKITNHNTKNRIGKYSNHINSPLILSTNPHPPTTDHSNPSTKLRIHQLVSAIKNVLFFFFFFKAHQCSTAMGSASPSHRIHNRYNVPAYHLLCKNTIDMHTVFTVQSPPPPSINIQGQGIQYTSTSGAST